jgi:hypothetical protein
MLLLLSLLILPSCSAAQDSAPEPKRVNGLEFTLQNPTLQNDILTLPWQLNYRGARPSVAILKPTLVQATCGQTQLVLIARTGMGRHKLHLDSPYQLCKYWIGREGFISVKTGESARGTTRVELTEQWSQFEPPLSGGSSIEKLEVHLIHKPTDRGESFQLDAWTGEVKATAVTELSR